MFSDMAVPTLAVVENMSYYDCDNPACGKRHRPFGGAADGDAHAAELAEAHGLDARFTLPLCFRACLVYVGEEHAMCVLPPQCQCGRGSSPCIHVW